MLFFFAGHLIEGTTVPLELYFEHRNYLPTIFLAIAAGNGIVALESSRGAAVAGLAGIVVIAILCALTAQRTSLWGDTDALLVYWAEQNPASERSQLEAGQVYLRHGDIARAVQHFDAGLAKNPGSISLLTMKLGSLCQVRRDSSADFETLEAALRTTSYGPNTLRAIQALLDARALDLCAAAPPHSQAKIADALLANPSVMRAPTALQQALFVRGLAQLRDGRPSDAYSAFARALSERYEYEAGMRMVAELASASAPAYAMSLLDVIEHRERDEVGAASGLPVFGLQRHSAKLHLLEIEHLRKVLTEDLHRTGDE
jgi:hypothetical protein